MAEAEFKVIHPEITVKLVGTNGNAFALMGLVSKALKKADVPQYEVDQFFKDATAGDYDHLLQVCMEWVTVV